MKIFYVFAFANHRIKEGTGLVGWRDNYSFDRRRDAENRRAELKASPPKVQQGKVLRRVIKEEEWP